MSIAFITEERIAQAGCSGSKGCNCLFPLRPVSFASPCASPCLRRAAPGRRVDTAACGARRRGVPPVDPAARVRHTPHTRSGGADSGSRAPCGWRRRSASGCREGTGCGQSRSETESPTDPARPAAPGAVTRLQFIWPHLVAVQRPAEPSVVADSTDVTSRL